MLQTYVNKVLPTENSNLVLLSPFAFHVVEIFYFVKILLQKRISDLNFIHDNLKTIQIKSNPSNKYMSKVKNRNTRTINNKNCRPMKSFYFFFRSHNTGF